VLVAFGSFFYLFDDYIWYLRTINMCDWRKIKNASSVLRHLASTWWESLSSSDKPHTWNGMKIVMRETFVQPSLVIYSSDEVHQPNQSLVIPLAMPNLL